LPLIIYAWEKALQNGLGKEKASVSLNSIVFEPKQAAEQIIYNQQKILLKASNLGRQKYNHLKK